MIKPKKQWAGANGYLAVLIKDIAVRTLWAQITFE